MGVLGVSDQVGVEPGLAGVIQHHGDEQHLTVVQRDPELTAIGPDDHVLHHTLAQMPHGFRDAAQVLDVRDGQVGMAELRDMLGEDGAKILVGQAIGLEEQRRF